MTVMQHFVPELSLFLSYMCVRCAYFIIHLDSEANMEFSSLSLDDQVALVPSTAEDAIQSWEKLWSDLKELQELTTEFGRIVAEQQERIDVVNENIDQAEQLIEQGRGELSKVSLKPPTDTH